MKLLIAGFSICLAFNIYAFGNSEKNVQTISVSGTGVVFAKPDMATISIGIMEIGKTTKEAQEKANFKINRVLELLKENGLSDKDIATSQLRFNIEQQWDSEKRIYIELGRKVEQTINIKIRQLQNDMDKVSTILDELGNVDRIYIHSINFDVEDKEPLYTQARERAYNKAVDKGEQFAELSKLTLGKPLSISEDTGSFSAPVGNFMLSESKSLGYSGDTSLPSGEIKISYNTNVIFLVK